ncbi:MAG TPA: hypothetical protein VFA20_21085 [Myxococcaceae bacterium]|nr:hypothetical protein [Myxococcaceae bacterium]
MTDRLGRRFHPYALAIALALPGIAWAEGNKVEVMADVVLASNNGNKVEPPALEEAKKFFEAKNVKYSSWQSLSQRRLSLEPKKTAEVPLPNGKKAQFTLESVANDVATVKVTVAPTTLTLQLGREGNLYVDGGQHQGGQVFVMISPALKPAGK